jgi:hypothetical protein
MMTRMASLLSSFALLALVAQCHGGATCDEKLQAANKALEAMKVEYAALENKLKDAHDDTYVTAEAIVNVGGDVLNTLGASSLNLSSMTKLNIPVVDVDVSKVTEAVSNGYDAAKGAIMSAVGVAQGLHDEHLLPHASEYYKATVPHVEAAQKAYYDKVHPHVAEVSAKVGAAVEQTKKGLKDKFEELTLKFSAALEGTPGTPSTYLVKLYEPREISFLGYKKVFTHGFLDVALFFVQLIANLYVGLLVFWQLLKLLLWKCGLGVKVAKFGVKASLGVTKTTTSGAFSVFFFLLSVIFWAFMLGLFFAVGVSVMHGIEKNAKLGTDVSVRMAAGASIGVFLMLIYCCCCCKRRKARTDTPGKKGSSSKSNGTSANGSKAKAKAEPKKEEPKAKSTASHAKKPHGKK